jgi:hypothetical protein
MQKGKQDNNALGAYSAMNRQIGRGKKNAPSRNA